MSRPLYLPPWEDGPKTCELDAIYKAANGAYDRIRDEIEEEHPVGAYIMIDGSDPSGSTHTVGSDAIEVQEKHYRDYPNGFATSFLFTVGRD